MLAAILRPGVHRLYVLDAALPCSLRQTGACVRLALGPVWKTGDLFAANRPVICPVKSPLTWLSLVAFAQIHHIFRNPRQAAALNNLAGFRVPNFGPGRRSAWIVGLLRNTFVAGSALLLRLAMA